MTHRCWSGKLIFTGPETRIQAGDGRVVRTRPEHVGELRERLGSREG